jgi:hypothetical protein
LNIANPLEQRGLNLDARRADGKPYWIDAVLDNRVSKHHRDHFV